MLSQSPRGLSRLLRSGLTGMAGVEVADPAALLRVAVDVVDVAAGFLRERSGQVRVAHTKTSPTDIVTTDDTAVEQLITTRLRQLRPHDTVLGEELGDGRPHDGARSGVRWLVDPIDGTVNYYYGLPTWSISVAAQVEGVAVAGVVAAPQLGRRYTALRGQGAWCNDVPLHCSHSGTLALALVATGFSYEAQHRREQADALRMVLPAVRDVRRFGSAALDLCLLAAGEVDAFYERGLAEYDRAAGMLVAREAGALVAVDGGLTWGAAPWLAPELLQLLRAAGA